MLTKLSFKISLFAAAVTFAYCFLTDINLRDVINRTLVVFSGFYLILIIFFIVVRVILRPGQEEMEQAASDKNTGSEKGQERLAKDKAVGV